MKRIALVVAAAVGAAFLFLHPVAPPQPATGWSASARAGRAPARSAEAFDRAPSERGAPGGAAGPAPGATGAGPAPRPAVLVYVAGDVARPGVYAVSPEARARDALALAGGAKPGADLVAVNLAGHVADGDEIVVPTIGDSPPRAARRRRRGRAGSHAEPGGSSSSPEPHRKRHRAKHPRATSRDDGAGPAPGGLVDLNAADAATLATIPGIGPGLAERIVAFRQANGPFASVDELLDVSGITDRRLDAILPYVVAR